MTNTLFNSGQSMTLLNGNSYTLLAGEVGINGVVYNQADLESVIKDEDPKTTAKNTAYFSAGVALSRSLTNKVRIGIKKLEGIEDMPAEFSKYDDWIIDNVRQTTLNTCIVNVGNAVLRGENLLILDTAVTGTYEIDWSKGSTWFLTLTGATVFSEVNLPNTGITKVITLYVDGDFAPTWPVAWDDNFTPIGAYDGLKNNQVVIEYVKAGFYWQVITQDT